MDWMNHFINTFSYPCVDYEEIIHLKLQDEKERRGDLTFAVKNRARLIALLAAAFLPCLRTINVNRRT